MVNQIARPVVLVQILLTIKSYVINKIISYVFWCIIYNIFVVNHG